MREAINFVKKAVYGKIGSYWKNELFLRETFKKAINSDHRDALEGALKLMLENEGFFLYSGERKMCKAILKRINNGKN